MYTSHIPLFPANPGADHLIVTGAINQPLPCLLSEVVLGLGASGF